MYFTKPCLILLYLVWVLALKIFKDFPNPCQVLIFFYDLRQMCILCILAVWLEKYFLLCYGYVIRLQIGSEICLRSQIFNVLYNIIHPTGQEHKILHDVLENITGVERCLGTYVSWKRKGERCQASPYTDSKCCLKHRN